MTRKIDIVVAAHEVHVESDNKDDSLEDLHQLAMEIFNDTKVDARKSAMGFDIGGTSSSAERAHPFTPTYGEWGSDV